MMAPQLQADNNCGTGDPSFVPTALYDVIMLGRHERLELRSTLELDPAECDVNVARWGSSPDHKWTTRLDMVVNEHAQRWLVSVNERELRHPRRVLPPILRAKLILCNNRDTFSELVAREIYPQWVYPVRDT
jgi:hypothetical protein